MDPESYRRWYDYSKARDMMFKTTDTKRCPWYVVPSNDKRRARLNCISQILDLIVYKKVPREKIRLPNRSSKGKYDDLASLKGHNLVPQRFWRWSSELPARIGLAGLTHSRQAWTVCSRFL
jgi:hypothetical protein